jgi:hypothetical protein
MLAMENPERAVAVLEQLSAAGAGISIDGFATGYSSFSYLNQFAFDTIKVDKAFVQARSQNGTGGAALRSIIALAHELGKKVVAEGVEIEDDVGFLRSVGCEYGQGYYYGEPMPERDVVQLLKVVRRAERRLKKSVLFRQRAKARTEVADASEDIQPIANGAPPPPPAPPQAANGNGRKPPRPPSGAPPSRPAPPANGGPPRMPPPLPGQGVQPAHAAMAPPVNFEPSPLRSDGPATAPPGVPPPPPGHSMPEPTRPRTAPPNGGGMASGPPRTPPPLPPRARPASTEPPTTRPTMPPAAVRAPRGPGPDLSKLPPAIRASLARLAGEAVEEDGPKGPPSAPQV